MSCFDDVLWPLAVFALGAFVAWTALRDQAKP